MSLPPSGRPLISFFFNLPSYFFFLGTSLRRVISWRSELLDLLPPSPTLCRGAQRASSTGKTKFSWTSLSQLIYWWGRFTLVDIIAFPSNGGVEKIQTPLKNFKQFLFSYSYEWLWHLLCVSQGVAASERHRGFVEGSRMEKDEYNEMCMEKNPLNNGFSKKISDILTFVVHHRHALFYPSFD